MPMQAMEMRFFGGFSLGVFAPRMGKKGSCKADDQYWKAAGNKTLQGCFLACQEDSQCENVFVPFVDIVYMEKPPPVQCMLLGAIKDPSAACTEGTGTLINKLPGARSCAHTWTGADTPLAMGAPPLAVGPPSPMCP